MYKKLIIIIPMILITACCGQTDDNPTIEKQTIKNTGRFTVESQGSFPSGKYGYYDREILIITDIQTGIQYLSVSGVGVSQLFPKKNGKSTSIREE